MSYCFSMSPLRFNKYLKLTTFEPKFLISQPPKYIFCRPPTINGDPLFQVLWPKTFILSSIPLYLTPYTQPPAISTDYQLKYIQNQIIPHTDTEVHKSDHVSPVPPRLQCLSVPFGKNAKGLTVVRKPCTFCPPVFSLTLYPTLPLSHPDPVMLVSWLFLSTLHTYHSLCMECSFSRCPAACLTDI